jgi:hypothetical protein
MIVEDSSTTSTISTTSRGANFDVVGSAESVDMTSTSGMNERVRVTRSSTACVIAYSPGQLWLSASTSRTTTV